MEHENYTIEDLAKRLGKDKREVEKLASRGRIPGRKVGGVWQFHPTEITRWLESAAGLATYVITPASHFKCLTANDNSGVERNESKRKT